ncbi:MAG: hypothetical protein AAFO94_08105 [Bacteroidota bacterium]
MNALDIIQDSLGEFFNTFAAALPRLVSGIILLILGWVIARIIKWGVLKLLRLLQFDTLTQRIGINDFLLKGNIRLSGTELLANLIYWIIMLSIWMGFFNALGLDVVSELLNRVILFIPNLIVACVLIVAGMYLAEFASGLVTASLKAGQFESADAVGRIAYGLIIFFVVAMILYQLSIGKEIVQTIVAIVLGSIGLALALAFGLGGKQFAKELLNRYVKWW